MRAPAGQHRGGTQEEIALHALAGIVARRRERLAGTTPAAAAEPAGFCVDPVCGMTVDQAAAQHRVDHEGACFAFCSAHCAERFAADPVHFLSATAR